MIIMVGNGAQAGSLSPFAPTGVIVNGLMEKIGLPGQEWHTYWTNLAAHALVAFGAYFLFGGLKLFRSSQVVTIEQKPEDIELETSHWITIVVIGTLLVGVLFFEVNVGMGALAGAVILAILGAADHKRSREEDAVVRHRDDERRDGADLRCWRRPEASICSPRCWPRWRRRAPSPASSRS